MENIIIYLMIVISLLIAALFLWFAAIGFVDLVEENPGIAFLLFMLGGVPLVIVAAIRGFAKEASENSGTAGCGCLLLVLFGLLALVGYFIQSR